MKRIISRVLILLGLTFIAIGRKLDKPDGVARRGQPPAARCVIILPRRRYRRIPPSRWEVFKVSLEIAFSSVAFATVGV